MTYIFKILTFSILLDICTHATAVGYGLNAVDY